MSYLLGHAGGMTGRYVVDDIDALRRDLERHVWSAERESSNTAEAVAAPLTVRPSSTG